MPLTWASLSPAWARAAAFAFSLPISPEAGAEASGDFIPSLLYRLPGLGARCEDCPLRLPCFDGAARPPGGRSLHGRFQLPVTGERPAGLAFILPGSLA